MLLTTSIRVTNIASLSSVPATFLERIYGFWTAYLLAFSFLWIAIGLLIFCSSKLGKDSS
jgi:POT family proton-dependent oligopeptide transporter